MNLGFPPGKPSSRCCAVGSARGLGPRGRRFESCHLDQAEPGRTSRSGLGFFFCPAARVGSGIYFVTPTHVPVSPCGLPGLSFGKMPASLYRLPLLPAKSHALLVDALTTLPLAANFLRIREFSSGFLFCHLNPGGCTPGNPAPHFPRCVSCPRSDCKCHAKNTLFTGYIQ